jgi:uncharacterized protein YjdB
MRTRLVLAAVATLTTDVLAACGGSGTSDAPPPVPVTHVAITPCPSVSVGETTQLTATLEPANATDQRVRWESRDPAVATVSATGLLTGVAAGTVTVSARTADGPFALCGMTVSPVAVTGVAVAPASLDLDVELAPTGVLIATVAPANATDQRVLWRSSDLRVATVSEAGLVTGVQGGSAVVTATTVDGGKAATAVVRVAAPIVGVTGVTLAKTSTYLLVGGKEQLVASVAPARATERRVAWSTSNATVARVTATGLVTGIAAGQAVITVTTLDGGFTATCTVTVQPAAVAVTGVSLDSSSVVVTAGSPGSSAFLTATVAPAHATNAGLVWEIRPSGIANLTASGTTARITGVKLGVATVTVTSQDNAAVSATATVHVTPVPVTGVALSSSTVTLTAAPAGAANGTTLPLTATVAPADATNAEVQWTTSDAAVATLTSTGGSTVTVVAHQQGVATITVTTADGGKTAQCAVTVNRAPVFVVPVAAISVDPVTLDPVTLDLEAGSTGTITAYLRPANATNQGVHWTSSDPAVAGLSATTGSVVTLTGGNPGTATVTATSVDGARSVSTDVKVWILDAEIASSTVRALTADLNDSYSTRSASGAFVEIPVDKLLYYGLDRAFLQGATRGIVLDFYASGSYTAPAALGDSVGLAGQNTVVQVKSYVGVAAARLANVGTASVKVAVTASAERGSPRVALWAQGRVVGVSGVVTAGGTYTFDGVPVGQINVFDGGLDSSRLSIEAIRIEPSSTTPVFAP